MKRGLAAEIQRLQLKKRNGQFTILDLTYDVDFLVDRRPCVFDRIDQVVLSDLTGDETLMEYDPEMNGS